MLRLREGGWVLLLCAVLMAAIAVWRLPSILSSPGAVGDGEDPDSYGFDLAALTVDRGQLTGSGMPRDGLRALIDPPPSTVAEIDALSWGGHGHGHFLVPSDRVIGVEAGGEARAYPLSILNWHEVANDTLGGVPIVVTYNPLAEAAAVFDRRQAGATRTFAFSGLLLASSLLMYDREGETLWSPLLGAGIAGPAVGQELHPVEYALIRWGDWLGRHPDTTVMGPDLDLKRVYKRKPYESYRGSQLLRFPVQPTPDDPSIALKDPVVGVEIAGERRGFPVDRIYGRAGENGRWQTSLGGQPLTFETGTAPTVFVTAPEGTARVWYASWFAWYALHPDDPVLPEAGDP